METGDFMFLAEVDHEKYPDANQRSRSTSRSPVKPTPLTEWIMPMPRPARSSAARCIFFTSWSTGTEFVTKSDMAKKAS